MKSVKLFFSKTMILSLGIIFMLLHPFLQKNDGVTVNILTMEAPQIKGPMVKRAPDFKN